MGGTRDIKRMFGTWAGNYRNNLPEHLEAKLKKMLTDQGRTREASRHKAGSYTGGPRLPALERGAPASQSEEAILCGDLLRSGLER